MGKLYLSAAARALIRQPGYTFISLLGLAVAFASLLLIGVYVRTELAHDSWITGHGNVYRLGKTAAFPGQQSLKGNGSSPVEALWLRQDIPEIDAIARLWPRTHELGRGNVRFAGTVVWADPEIFEVLPLETVAGDLESALNEPDAIVISLGLAHRLLGAEQVIGERIEIDGRPMRIAAVLDDPPGASHLTLDAVVSSRSAMSPYVERLRQRIGFDPVYTYLRIAPGTLASIRTSLPALIDRHVSAADVPGIATGVRMSDMFTYELQALSDIHLMSQKDRLVAQHTTCSHPRERGAW